MRDLERNKRAIHYATWIGSKELYDDDGYPTGELGEEYADPVLYRINVGMDGGYARVTPEGIRLEYDREMVTADKNCPINEQSKLWIEVDINEPANYVVVGRFTSLNQVVFALRRL